MPKKTLMKKKENNLKVLVFKPGSKSTSTLSLPAELFAAKSKSMLVAQAIHGYEVNRHQGTHSTKTRSQVSGSTRKIYRQKGTGRARHGDIKAPIFVGGGVAHGPKPAQKRLAIPKYLRKQALVSALTERFSHGRIAIAEEIENSISRTKDLAAFIERIKSDILPKKKLGKFLMVTSERTSSFEQAARNLPYLTVGDVRTISAYDVFRVPYLILSKSALPILQERLGKSRKEDKKKG